MKTKNAILLMSVMVILTANNACKTPKSVEVATGAKEVSLPFSGKEFKSDKEYFRAMGSGKSPDKEDARRIAALSASQRLSANIKEVLSSAMRQYTQTLDGNGKQEFEGSFSNQTWTFVEQTLVHSTVKDEKLFIETDKTYTCYVVKEISTQPILEEVNNQISKNKKLEINYDQKKFAEDVDKEKQKMAEDRRANEK